ncbi:MAG: RNA 2',3'-cyclic phosphodiesterase [Candidatus Pacearchaeota archaeon]
MRAFISIDIPEDVKEKISKIQESLPEFKGKNTERENLHLTLKFLGEVGEEKVEEVGKRLKEVNFNSFETKADEIGVFDNRKSGKYKRKIIVWLHLVNCEELQRKVDEALSGLFKSEKRFMSHLTIARVKEVKAGGEEEFVEKLKEINLPKIRFNVKSFRLKESVLGKNGPKYKTIEEYC